MTRGQLGLGATLLLLALAGWRVATLGWADFESSRVPQHVLAVRGDHAEAHLQLALRLAGKDPAVAAPHARAALRARPLDGRPYRVLSAHAPNTAVAIALLRIAVARAPRDVPGHGALARDALQHADFAGAIAHFDQMLRVEPALLTRLYPVLQALAMAPEAQGALAARLGTAPPWREALLNRLSRKAPDSGALAPLFVGLSRTSTGLSPGELDQWLDRLVRDREFGPAYLTWVGSLPAERKRAIGNVYDGGFEGEPTGSGFDWRLERVPGAHIDLVRAEGAASGGASLRVAFDHRRVPFRHVRQLLALPPGDYRVSGRARLDSLSTERGLVWTVTCAEGGKPIGESDPFAGTQRDWRPFSFPVRVPAEKCGGQWLLLHLPARIAAEQQIGGSAWFDDLVAKRERGGE